jgi:hypothetical protein
MQPVERSWTGPKQRMPTFALPRKTLSSFLQSLPIPGTFNIADFQVFSFAGIQVLTP